MKNFSTHEIKYIYARACAIGSNVVRTFNRLNDILALLLVLAFSISLSAQENLSTSNSSRRRPGASEIRQRWSAEQSHRKKAEILKEIQTMDSTDAKELVNENDRDVRESAVLTLGQNPQDDNSATLKEVAEKETDLGVRTAAIQGLGKIQSEARTLREILNDTNEAIAVRQAAASSLSLAGDKDTLEYLLGIWRSTDGELKEHVKICLENFRSLFPSVVEDAIGEPNQ